MSIDKREKEKKYNHLAAAEVGEEANYNMIDGIINNTPKPSVMEKIRDYERQIAELPNGNFNTNEDEPKVSRPAREDL